MRPALTLLTSTTLLVLSRVASAVTFFVAPGGNNANTGGSDKPWATLQFAVDRIAPGDTILVKSGTYVGARIQKSGQPGAPKVLKAAVGAAVLINAPGPANRHASDIEIEQFGAIVTDWIIDGLQVTGATRYGIDLRSTDRITVQFCNVHNSGLTGIFTAFSNHALVHDNVTAFNNEHGIYFSNSGDFPIARANQVHHNRKSGIQLNADVFQGGDGIISSALVEKNVIFENGVAGGAAINLDGVSDGMFRNNLLYSNHASGIALYAIDGGEGSSRDQVYNNTIVMAAGARNVILLLPSPAGVMDPTNDRIENNILFTPDANQASISIDAAHAPGFFSDYNVVVNRIRADGNTLISLAQWRALGLGAGMGHDQRSILSVPSLLFVNAAASDFHLKSGSPAINAGRALLNVVDDLEGTPRPQGCCTDIGSYEAH
jgi:hypothetical protein